MGRINPTFIDNMGQHMGDVYGAVTDQILINLARYFPYYKPGQPVPQSSFEYQSVMLAQMGRFTDETVNIIRNGLSGADEALKNVLSQAIVESVKKAQPDLLKGMSYGLIFPYKPPVVSPEQMNAFWSHYRQAADKLNLVNTVMLESTRQAYQLTVSDITNRIRATQDALDIGAAETITGVSSWNQATYHAINRMKANGITGFIDHAGRRWNAESYVSMDIRTTLANTARAAVWETNQNFGNDLYQVSYHNGARPLCYPWQNKVISSTDNSRVVKDLDGNDVTVYSQSETSYGEPAGLFGINCKHYPTPFIPGVSATRGEPQNEEDNDRTYAESQQQRALERKIREEKRDLLMLKAQNAPDELIRAQRARIRQTDDDIDNFCEETGRHRRQNREGVYTKREFPDPKTYDVELFEREQKELIDRYFASGGAQRNFTFGTMTPKVPIAPIQQNVAAKATKAKPKAVTIKAEKLDATNFPDRFNKKKTKAFVDAVNSTEGTDPNVVKLFNTMGAQVDGANYPIEISYTEKNHEVSEWVSIRTGERSKLAVKVPKLADAEYLRQEVATTAHEWGHLFDHINSAKRGVLSADFDNGALSKALTSARPMSARVKNMIDNAIKEAKIAEKAATDAIMKQIDEIDKKISQALSARNYGAFNTLSKERNKLWKEVSSAASKASRKAHKGLNAVEDIYDAISGGTLRDKTAGLYGHGSGYYKRNPGGANAATETIANYCALALAYPDLFKLMAEEQPEIWEACGNIIAAMIGG